MTRLFAALPLGLLLCVAAGGGCRMAPPPASPSTLLARAATYLWDQQHPDGGWHSDTHGIARGGQAWTPFILHTLLTVPDSLVAPPSDGVERALAFLRRHADSAGVLGLSDPNVLEYPNYATAYALRALVRAGKPSDAPLIARMTRYLAAQQFAEGRGIAPGHPVYGAWGFGEQHLPPGGVGYVDLSHTRRVLEALHAAGHADSALYRRARGFLERVQATPPAPDALTDGGFFGSPVVPSANKGGFVFGPDGTLHARSYATATCDGLLALRAAGAPVDAPPVAAAGRWLAAHPVLAYPEGIPHDDPMQWHAVLFYYHLNVRTAAYRTLAYGGAWPDAVTALLAARQAPTGAFANPAGAPNKEDDPLIATALTVETLLHVLAACGPACL